METNLFFDLTSSSLYIHFCEANELGSISENLKAHRVALFEIDGTTIRDREDLFKAFAVALKVPKGWYGNEEYAPNADAFLEYLDGVHEWVPAKGHVVLLRGAERFWTLSGRLAGLLVELWQCATGGRDSDIHLVFVW